MLKVQAIAVTLITAASLGMFSVNAEQSVSEQVRPIAVVHRFQPEVLLAKSQGETIELDLEENTGEYLFSGDTLTTMEKGYALVLFTNDRSVAKVKPESQLIIYGETMAESKISDRRIDLKQGEVFLEMEPQGTSTFEVTTSRSLASVKGTRFGKKFDGFVWVEEGQVDLTAINSGETISLFKQMFGEVDEEGNNVSSGMLTDDELNSLQEGYDQLSDDLIEKEIIFRFRDANGQIREIPVQIFEKEN